MAAGIPSTLQQTLELAAVTVFLTTTVAAVLASMFVRRTNMFFLGIQLILLSVSAHLAHDWLYPLVFRDIIPDPQVLRAATSTALFFSVGFTVDMALSVFVWHGPLAREGHQAFPKLLIAVVKVLLYLVVTLLVLQFVFEKSITALATLSGAFALILGLSAQTTLGEMFAGIALALSRPFAVGDWIKVSNLPDGRVIDMTWRMVRIETRDRNVINVPNRVMADATIQNFSRPHGVTRITDLICFGQSDDPVMVQEMLVAAMSEADHVLRAPQPSALYRGAKDGIGDYQIRYFIDDYRLRDDATESVWKCIVAHAARAKLRIEVRRQNVEVWREVRPAVAT